MKRRSANYQAISKLADEFSRRLPTLLAQRRRRFKTVVIDAMTESAVQRMRPTELRRFLSMWRGILLDLEKERNANAAANVGEIQGAGNDHPQPQG